MLSRKLYNLAVTIYVCGIFICSLEARGTLIEPAVLSGGAPKCSKYLSVNHERNGGQSTAMEIEKLSGWNCPEKEELWYWYWYCLLRLVSHFTRKIFNQNLTKIYFPLLLSISFSFPGVEH
jgi:hypothetical protein